MSEPSRADKESEARRQLGLARDMLKSCIGAPFTASERDACVQHITNAFHLIGTPSAGEGRSETELDLGPYDAISSLKGARYKLIMPSATPFVANVIAEVPDLNMARTIIERYNAHEKLLRRVATLILECAKAETEAETAGANSATTSLTDVELGEIIYSRVSGPTQLRNAIAKAIVHDIRTADRKAT